jgi:hypothetical protein
MTLVLLLMNMVSVRQKLSMPPNRVNNKSCLFQQRNYRSKGNNAINYSNLSPGGDVFCRWTSQSSGLMQRYFCMFLLCFICLCKLQLPSHHSSQSLCHPPHMRQSFLQNVVRQYFSILSDSDTAVYVFHM